MLILTFWFVTRFDTDLFPDENSPNIAKSNRVFPVKGKKDRALILTYLDSPKVDVFPHYSLSFSISVTFRGKWVIKVGPKMKILGLSLFHENSNPSNLFQQCFCLLKYYLWWDFWQYCIIFGGVRAQKPPKKGRGM